MMLDWSVPIERISDGSPLTLLTNEEMQGSWGNRNPTSRGEYWAKDETGQRFCYLSDGRASGSRNGQAPVVRNVRIPMLSPDDEIRMMPMPIDLSALADEIHAANVTAGWWTDLATGVSILATRNRGELMMLVCSELAEASFGIDTGGPDDKLPDYPMFDVELADTAIRLLDMIGAERSLGLDVVLIDVAPTASEIVEFRHAGSRDLLLDIGCVVAGAMEHHRKGRIAEYAGELVSALWHLMVLAAVRQVDLFAMIAAKREFNATRADHRIDSRKAAGGKAY